MFTINNTKFKLYKSNEIIIINEEVIQEILFNRKHPIIKETIKAALISRDDIN